MEQLRELLDLLSASCLAESVVALLRQVNGSRRSAENKEQLIYRNLREAVETGLVPFSRLVDLLRDTEENGFQEIRYFRAKSNLVTSSLYSNVAALVQRHGLSSSDLPQFSTEKLGIGEYLYADLRQESGRRPEEWTLKLYGKEATERLSGETEASGQTIRMYSREVFRSVCVVHWNRFSLLEIRLPRTTSRQRSQHWLDIVWKMLDPVIKVSDFEAWDLKVALTNLAAGNTTSFKTTELRSVGEGTQTIASSGLVADEALGRDLLSSMLSHSDVQAISGEWLFDGKLSDRWLRSIINRPNHVVIPGYANADDVNSITERLVALNRAAVSKSTRPKPAAPTLTKLADDVSEEEWDAFEVALACEPEKRREIIVKFVEECSSRGPKAKSQAMRVLRFGGVPHDTGTYIGQVNLSSGHFANVNLGTQSGDITASLGSPSAEPHLQISFSDALKRLLDQVQKEHLEGKNKQFIIDGLATLSQEALRDRHDQHSGIINALLSTMPTWISGSPHLETLWRLASPIIIDYFAAYLH